MDVKTIINRYLRNDFLRHNAVFFVGTLTIAMFNYLYYPVIGRLVSVSDFGQIQAVIAIFMQLGIVLTAFGYVVTNIINNTKNHEQSNRLIIKLERMTLAVCVFIFISLLFSSTLLKDSLQFTSLTPLMLVGLLVVLNVPSTSRSYVLQGLRHLVEVSISGVIFAVGKLIISVVLIFLGHDVIAVMLGYILAQMITLIYLRVKTMEVFPSLRESFTFRHRSNEDRRVIRAEVIYGIAIIAMLSGMTLLYSSDSIVVRLFFSPEDAGMYSAISAIARIVFFVTASVAGVLLATVRMEDSRTHNVGILIKSAALIVAIGGVVALFFALFPKLSVTILFGAKYVGAAHLLPLMSLLMLVCSLNNLLVCYEISLRRFKSIAFVALGVGLFAVSILGFHGSLNDIILGYLISNIVVLVLLSVYILKRKDHAETTAISRTAQLQ